MKVSLYAAKTQLSQLIDRVVRGEEIVVTRHGRPVAKLVAAEPKRKRRLGKLRGKIHIRADFDATLPEDVLAAFEGR